MYQRTSSPSSSAAWAASGADCVACVIGERFSTMPIEAVPLVERQARFVQLTCPGGLNAWPRNGEPVGIDRQLGEQVQIAVHAVVVVTGHLARRTVGDCARATAEFIPDRFTLAVRGGGA